MHKPAIFPARLVSALLVPARLASARLASARLVSAQWAARLVSAQWAARLVSARWLPVPNGPSRWIFASWGLILCFIFTITAPVFGQTPDSEYGLLWEVNHPDQGKPSYLFGTMHVMDENIFNLPDSVFIGIEACDGFATEVAFDEAMNEVVSWYIERADEIEGKRRSANLERRLKSLLGDSKKGGDPLALFQDMGENYQAGKDQSTFLDAWLYRIARDGGKVVGGVEDMESQMVLLLDEDNLFGGGSGRVGIDFLKAAYIKGDLKAIQAFLESDEVSDGFRDQVLTERNYGMAERADSLIGERPTFVAVGAAHLPGKEGVIELMRNRGYQLRRMEATYTGMADDFKNLPFKPIWQTFEDSDMGIRVEVPAKPFPVSVMDLTTMQFGMDLPGGFFYAFYRLQLPVYLGESERAATITEVVSAMGNEIKERKAVVIGDFEGEEIYAAAQDFDFRVRVLFDGKSMLFMLAGISEEMVRSEVADRFMESVETFVPPSIFSRKWEQQEFETTSFSVKFPGKPVYVYDPGYADENGDEIEFHSYLYDMEDKFHNQYVMVRVSDTDPLTNGLPDSSWTYEIASEFADVAAEDLEVKSVTRNGIQGWETRGQADGYTLHFRQVNRGFRSYLLLLSALEEDSLGSRVNLFFDSFEFEPMPAPYLGVRFEAENFKVSLPEEPREGSSWAYIFMDGAEGVNTWGVRDQSSATGFLIESYELSTYFRTDHPDSLLRHYQGDFGDDFEELENSFSEERGMLVADRRLEQKGGGIKVFQRHYLDSTHVREFSIRVAGDVENLNFVKAFYQSLEIEPEGDYTYFKAGKAREILQTLSEDGEGAEAAANSIWRYNPLPEEEKLFMDFMSDHPEISPRILGSVGQLIAGFDNPKSDAFLFDNFALLNRDPDAQSEIISMMYGSERAEARKLGAQLFAEYQPVALDEIVVDEMIGAIIFSDSSSFWKEDNLRLLTSKGAYFHALTYELFYHIALEDWEPEEVREALDIQLGLAHEIIDKGLAGGDDAQYYHRAFENLSNCFEYVKWGNKEADFSRRMFDMAEMSFQVRCAIKLLEHQEEVEKDRLVGFASNREYGFPLLEYLVGEGKRKLIPGKYFKQKLAAEMSLRNRIGADSDYGWGAVNDLELLQKEKLYWKGISANLYVYKVMLEGESDWMVGFSGPFFADKDVAWPTQELTGLSYRVYDESRLKRLITDWIRTDGDL